MSNSTRSISLIFAVLALTTATEAKPKVEFSPAAGAINVIVDGKPLTSYVHTIDPARPCLLYTSPSPRD